MSKGPVFLILIAAAIAVAGSFGALHNQLSYSVGPTYFHDFKFAQFAVPPDLHNRLGAALVGWRASWWMGALVGLPAFVLGLVMIVRAKTYLAAGFGAIFAVVLLTLVASMAGLFAGMALTDLPLVQSIAIPDGVTDRDAFLRAALMHEASYLGGFLGLVVAVMIIWRTARAERNRLRARKQV